MSKKIAIITARGGSKRIPRKNIKEFCGKPIITYSIQAAIESGIFDEVMVSTDDREIAEIAKEYGANVPFFRSEKTSNDTATTYDVLEEVIREYEKMGKIYDYTCCIYPTAPFVTSEKVIDAMTILERENADTVLPVMQFSFPPQRAFVLDEHKNIQFQYPKYELTRSQDLEPIYHDCGQFYCLNVMELKKQKKLMMKKSMPIFVSETEAQDIDNEDDWRLAELKYKFMINK